MIESRATTGEAAGWTGSSIAAMAVRNAVRRPLRSLVTVLGVAVAAATFFSLASLQRGYEQGVRSELDRLGAHILVVPRGCPYDAASIALHGASWPCYLKWAYLRQVATTPGVATAAPALMTAFYGPDGSSTVYEGIDRSMLLVRRGWKIRGSFPAAPGDVMIGSRTASRKGWTVGQAVTLPGLEPRSARVSGILAPTGGADDEFIFTGMADAQRWFNHPGELTHILVRLRDPDQVEDVVDQLHGCGAGLEMNVVPLTHLFNTIRGLLASTRVLLGSVMLVALLIAAAGVANTMAMAMLERMPEIGMLRAIGASRGQVFTLVLVEGLALALAGSTLGIAAAALVGHSLEAWLRGRLPFAPTDPLMGWSWLAFGATLGVGALLGALAGMAPAVRAAYVAPIDVMRGGTGR